MSSEDHILILMLKSTLVTTSQLLRLKPSDYIIGRDPDCDIVVADPYVSRKHAKIFYREGKWFIEDIGSRNGTFVDGEDIRGREAVELRENMEIVIGFSTLLVKGFEKG